MSFSNGFLSLFIECYTDLYSRLSCRLRCNGSTNPHSCIMHEYSALATVYIRSQSGSHRPPFRNDSNCSIRFTNRTPPPSSSQSFARFSSQPPQQFPSIPVQLCLTGKLGFTGGVYASRERPPIASESARISAPLSRHRSSNSRRTSLASCEVGARAFSNRSSRPRDGKCMVTDGLEAVRQHQHQLRQQQQQDIADLQPPS